MDARQPGRWVARAQRGTVHQLRELANRLERLPLASAAEALTLLGPVTAQLFRDAAPIGAAPMAASSTRAAPPGIQRYGFLVNDRPQTVWDTNLGEKNLAFLRGFSPDVLAHLVDTHGDLLEGEDGVAAALAIRVAYSLALESFFSLLLAALQAPACAVAWLVQYRVDDLLEMVSAITRGQPIACRFPLSDVSWEGIARLVFGTARNPRPTVNLFGRVWRRLADDCLNPSFAAEYNSLKHGLRSRPQRQGFGVTMTLETESGPQGLPPDPGNWIGSRHGSTYFFAKPISGANAGKVFRLQELTRGWSPGALAMRTILATLSMQNVVAFLLRCAQVPEEDPQLAQHTLQDPEQILLEAFAEPGLNEMAWNTPVDESAIDPEAEEVIRSHYQQSGASPPEDVDPDRRQ